MKIHKEGYTTIFLFTLFVLGMAFTLNIIWPSNGSFHYLAYGLLAVLLMVVTWFFRMPTRDLLFDETLVISPADGKVVVVEQTFEPEYLLNERIQVSVFMSPLNVHVNFFPVSGILTYFKYHPGKHLVAWNPKSSTENERTTLAINTKKYGEIMVRQIAGALARRIVCYAQEGKNIEQGSELGFIKLGSRVDIFLPIGTEILVKPGQPVIGGETPIARLNNLKKA